MNSLTHGLTSEHLIFKLIESTEIYEEKLEGYVKEFRPVTEHEWFLVKRLANEACQEIRLTYLLTQAMNEITSEETAGKDALKAMSQGLAALMKNQRAAAYRVDNTYHVLVKHKAARFGEKDKGGYGQDPTTPFYRRIWLKPKLKKTSEEEFLNHLHEYDYADMRTDCRDPFEVAKMLTLFKWQEKFLGHAPHTFDELGGMENEAKLAYKRRLENLSPICWERAMDEMNNLDPYKTSIIEPLTAEQYPELPPLVPQEPQDWPPAFKEQIENSRKLLEAEQQNPE